MTDRSGCLDTLSRPSCFGFLLFVALWLGLCGIADLAGPRSTTSSTSGPLPTAGPGDSGRVHVGGSGARPHPKIPPP